MNPSYTEESNRIVFHTSFGDYGFSKKLPSMSFAYRDGTPLITHSVFYVNSSMRTPMAFGNYTIERGSLTDSGIEYSATLRDRGGQLGTMRISVRFDRIERPKITVRVEPDPALNASGFNVLWIAQAPGTIARFKGTPAGLDFSNASRVEQRQVSEPRLELGPQGTPDSWRVWAVVDWSDAPTGTTIGFGRIGELPFLGGPVAVITFPSNLTYIDPTIVGQSNLTGSALSFQRRTFFDGAHYWAFYHDGSNTVYEYSSDGRTWNNPPIALWSYQRTAVWFNDGIVYALAGSSASGPVTVYLYFRKGTITGSTISWGAIMTVDSFVVGTGYLAQAEYRDVNLVVGVDGLITVVYTKAYTYMRVCGARCDTGDDSYWGSRTLQVKKSIDTGGSGWGSVVTVLSESSYAAGNEAAGRAAWYHRYLSILAPSASNEMLGVYNDLGSIRYSKSSAWGSVSTLVSSAKYIEEFGSAVSDASYAVHLVYVDNNDAINYASYGGAAWSTPLQIAPATSKSPTISLGTGNDLHVLYLRSGVIHHMRYSSFTGWGQASTPFGTAFASPAHLTATANAAGSFLVALWTEGTAAPYSIKLGSLPVENAWSPYTTPSNPWDQQGIIPYGHYFRNLDEFVSPYSGLLSVVQTDFALPGRGSDEPGVLAFTRVFRTPYTFLSGTPYNYENYPYANLGLGWGLNWPWLGTDYVHLWNGQGYKIVWTNNVYENHKGEHFKLTKNADNTFTLFPPSGTLCQFDAGKRLVSVTDRTHNNQMTFSYDSSNRISQVTDTVGRTIDFTYDGNGRLVTVNSGGRVWTFGYNANGNLVSAQDPLGRTTAYEYTSSYSGYLLTKITYPTHAYTTYGFTEAQIGTETKSYRVSQETTYLQDGTVVRQVSFAYTTGAADRTVSSTLTTSDGTAVQGYDAYDFSDPSKVTHSTKNAQAVTIAKTTDEYDSQGAIKKQTVFPGGGSSSYTNYFRFDNWGNKVYERLSIDAITCREIFYSYLNTNTQNRFVDFDGNNVTDFSNAFYANTIDSNIHDRLVGRAEYQNGAGTNRIESYYEYDTVGNRLQEKDLLAGAWLLTRYTHDSYGNVLTRTDAKGDQTSYDYSATYQYAYLTEMRSVVDGVAIATGFSYDFATGDRTTVTSPSGNPTDYQYDSIGRLTTAIYPLIGGVRAQRRVAYDDTNNIATVYDENNNYVKYYFDGLARQTKLETYADDTVYSTATYTYYWNDKINAYTDPTGNVTSYSIDFLGRVTKETHPDGTYRQWTYDDVTFKVTAYDEKGHPTDYVYDRLGRLVAVTEYLNGQAYTTTYTYDRVGNLLQIRDAANQITSYIYDNLNRRTRTTYPDTTYETRTYDNVGNLVSRTTQNGAVIGYSYDAIKRLTQISYPDGSTVAFTYDKDSNRIQMVDSASTTTYAYDARDRLLSETRTIAGQEYTLRYQYDAASNLIQLTYPDAYQLQYTYDAMKRITQVGNLATLTYQKDDRIGSITYGNGVQTTYLYDNRGRPTRILTRNSTATLLDLNYEYDANGNLLNVNSNQETYGYDDLNRLTSANGPWGTLSYTYDIVGNRLSQAVNGTETSYTYGTGNKLLSAGATSYTYDGNGNRLTQTSGSNSWNYIYDFENRLKQVTSDGQLILQAWYDGDGRRIKTVEGETIRVFAYLAGSWDPAYVNEASSGTVSDIIFARALRIGRVQAGENSYCHLDLLGSVRVETRSGNVQIFTGEYLPYGVPSATSGSSMFRYTGKQLDESTGLYYYGYRYYDSEVGRFVTPDTVEPKLVNPQSINRYVYALNSPNSFVDPDGRDSAKVLLGCALIALGAVVIVASLGAATPVGVGVAATGIALATGGVALTGTAVAGLGIAGLGVGMAVLGAMEGPSPADIAAVKAAENARKKLIDLAKLVHKLRGFMPDESAEEASTETTRQVGRTTVTTRTVTRGGKKVTTIEMYSTDNPLGRVHVRTVGIPGGGGWY